MSGKLKPVERWTLGLATAVGVALLVIGIRFLTVPQQATRFFGIGSPAGAFDLHHVVGLRDIWLALLLAGLAVLREWRALALCLGLGAVVCWGDAVIVASSSGRGTAIAFHLVSGLYCSVIAWMAWRCGLPRPPNE
jgi:hypothetical protein